jgi:hypothetical protein
VGVKWSLIPREEQVSIFWELDFEENTRILTYEEGSNTRLAKLHNEELHNLFSSLELIRIFNSRIMRVTINISSRTLL